MGIGTLGSDTYTAGATGDEATHALTVAELPSHSHGVDPPSTSTSTDGSHTHSHPYGNIYADRQFGGVGGLGAGSNVDRAPLNAGGDHAHSVDIASFTSAATGSGTEHKNGPPYVAVIYCQYNGGGGAGVRANALDDLADVVLTSPSTGQALVYNSGSNTWVNGAATAAASGSDGYVQFRSGSALSSDSALYWDNTNKRLGIGTAKSRAILARQGGRYLRRRHK